MIRNTTFTIVAAAWLLAVPGFAAVTTQTFTLNRAAIGTGTSANLTSGGFSITTTLTPGSFTNTGVNLAGLSAAVYRRSSSNTSDDNGSGTYSTTLPTGGTLPSLPAGEAWQDWKLVSAALNVETSSFRGGTAVTWNMAFTDGSVTHSQLGVGENTDLTFTLNGTYASPLNPGSLTLSFDELTFEAEVVALGNLVMTFENQSVAVPEPASPLLGVLGILLLLRRRRK